MACVVGGNDSIAVTRRLGARFRQLNRQQLSPRGWLGKGAMDCQRPPAVAADATLTRLAHRQQPALYRRARHETYAARIHTRPAPVAGKSKPTNSPRKAALRH